jgi:protein-arginine kinase
LLERIRSAPTDGILLCTRVRIGRSLSGRRWWENDSLAGQDETCALLDGFRREHLPELGLVADASLPVQEQELLGERLEINPALARRSGACWSAWSAPGDDRGITVNDEDHLRLWSQRSGCDPLGCLDDLSDWEELARTHLPLARDSRWGWATWNPALVGTGLQVGQLLFLPALRWTRRLGETQAALEAMGFVLSPVLEDEDTALVALANRIALGLTEPEIARRVEELSLRVAAEEARALEDLIRNQEDELRDAVSRSHALLGSASLLSRAELLRRLELCALGSRAGWIAPFHARMAAQLHFLTGKAHLTGMAGAVHREARPDLDDLRARAVAKAWTAP